jgi:hypothetical protein
VLFRSKRDRFFFIKKLTFLKKLYAYGSLVSFTLLWTFYEFHILNNVLPIRKKEPPLFEIGPPLSQTIPLQLFVFYSVSLHMLNF